ncbi:hypothetical protein GCM10023080_017200 [Streptomyces pseudoechinosporeus]
MLALEAGSAPMTAEALPLPDGPSAEVRFVSPYPEVTRQAADALRWFFAFDEDSSYRAGPTSARHGVDRGQIDPSAAVIRLLERLGWVYDVRWPAPDRVAARRV